MQAREKDRDHLKDLFDDLTSNLPADHPDKSCLGEPCEDVNKRWEALSSQLNDKEPQLCKLAEDAQTHESDYGNLCDWMGPAEERAAAMTTVPSELDAVQEQLKAMEVITPPWSYVLSLSLSPQRINVILIPITLHMNCLR